MWCCFYDKVTPHRRLVKCVTHTFSVTYQWNKHSELQKIGINCYFVFLNVVPAPVVFISGKSRWLYQEAEYRRWQIFTSSPTSVETIINHQFALFWQKQTGRHIWGHWRRHCLFHVPCSLPSADPNEYILSQKYFLFIAVVTVFCCYKDLLKQALVFYSTSVENS